MKHWRYVLAAVVALAIGAVLHGLFWTVGIVLVALTLIALVERRIHASR